MQAFLLLLKKSSKVKVRDPREDPTWFMHKNLEFFCFFFVYFRDLDCLPHPLSIFLDWLSYVLIVGKRAVEQLIHLSHLEKYNAYSSIWFGILNQLIMTH